MSRVEISREALIIKKRVDKVTCSIMEDVNIEEEKAQGSIIHYRLWISEFLDKLLRNKGTHKWISQ